MSTPGYRQFADMIWPVPSQRITDIDWQLRYSRDLSVMSRDDQFYITSVLQAFVQLVAMPEKRRREIVRELRKGEK